MNWIKENKFLTGFLAVTLIGAGVLAYLMITAMGRASTAQTNYDAAAAQLLRMLESMELVVNMLIANNVTEISEIKRDALPEEAGKEKGGKDSGKGGAKEDSAKSLVVRHPFEIAFVAHEGKFHKFIN